VFGKSCYSIDRTTMFPDMTLCELRVGSLGMEFQADWTLGVPTLE